MAIRNKKADNPQQLKEKLDCTNSSFISWFVLFSFILSFFFVYQFSSLLHSQPLFANMITIFNSYTHSNVNPPSTNFAMNEVDKCLGKYIYVQDLPSHFNKDILKNCAKLNLVDNMCDFIANSGLGLQINDSGHQVFSDMGWFNTHQFTLELIFHKRMKKYRCLTNDSSKATAIFVPFYPGLDIGGRLRAKDLKIRDAASTKLVEYLRHKPEWRRMQGRDHFVVIGRIDRDFRRSINASSAFGNRFLLLPEVKNMTSLVIERSVWDEGEFAIPYPTYFHPSSDREVLQWQDKMRKQSRPYLFSFAGGPRPGRWQTMRDEIFGQCLSSPKHCKFVGCDSVTKNCKKPETVMSLFEHSVFCLQPRGDSYTRRSTFDSILAGCIPVFFHPSSAYDQYIWHLPKNYSSYSVLIPAQEVKKDKYSIVRRLLAIPKAEVMAMREEVIRLIPRVIYANPNSRLENLEDAFDVSVQQVLNRIEKIK